MTTDTKINIYKDSREGVGYINKRKAKLLTRLLLLLRYLKVSDSLITLNDISSPNCTTVRCYTECAYNFGFIECSIFVFFKHELPITAATNADWAEMCVYWKLILRMR